MNIVFMGTPAYCIPSLEELNRHYNVTAVVTQPDTRANRGQKIFKSAVKRFAEREDIKIYQPVKIRKDEEVYNELRSLEPDFIIVIAYGQILPQKILDIPKYGCINIHGSILPKWRGAAPIQFSILNGDSSTGVTSIMMNSKMDEGDILKILRCDIEIEDNAGSLHDKLSELSARCVIETIEGILKKTIEPCEQNHSEATYTRLITKKDGFIDFNNKCEDVYNRFRAMTPWPGAFSYLHEKYIKFLDMEFVKENIETECGTILEDAKKNLKISCKDGYITVDKIQMAGKKAMLVKDFVNGNRDLLTKGSFFGEKK